MAPLSDDPSLSGCPSWPRDVSNQTRRRAASPSPLPRHHRGLDPEMRRRQASLIRPVPLIGLMLVGSKAMAAGLFVDPQSLEPHALQQVPPITPLARLETDQPNFFFSRPLADIPRWAVQRVESAPHSAWLGAGFWDGPDMYFSSAKARVTGNEGQVFGGYRHEAGNDYKDAQGKDIRWGYKKDTGHLTGTWAPRPDTRITAHALTDRYADVYLPNYGLDTPVESFA